MRKPALLLASLGLCSASTAATPTTIYPQVTPGRTFAFPADHGAHPDFRTEWWYVTGTLRTSDGKPLGFQVTFFRTRPKSDPRNPSAFAARQILFAHVALSDPAVGRLLHDQRAARSGFGIAAAKVGDADLRLKDWTLRRLADGRFATRIAARDFTLDLVFKPTQPVLLQGDRGYSRKGADPGSSSYYYSLPQLAASGSLTRGTRVERVSGQAWLDREWSSRYLGNAIGWDWTGLNFDDGSALMAFRMRGRDGSTIWAGGTFRRATGVTIALKPADVGFAVAKRWRSARTGAVYPVAQWLTIRLPEGTKRFALQPLFADQELDARASGLPVYWEGAVRTNGGAGYLELTGYAAPLTL